MLGIQFGVSESTAHYTFHYWQSILEQALPPSILEPEVLIVKKKSNKQTEK